MSEREWDDFKYTCRRCGVGSNESECPKCGAKHGHHDCMMCGRENETLRCQCGGLAFNPGTTGWRHCYTCYGAYYTHLGMSGVVSLIDPINGNPNIGRVHKCKGRPAMGPLKALAYFLLSILWRFTDEPTWKA